MMADFAKALGSVSVPAPAQMAADLYMQIRVDQDGCVWVAAAQFSEIIERLTRIEALLQGAVQEQGGA